MNKLNVIIIAALTISVLHSLMPNHWLPFSLAGKTHKWSLRRTIFITGAAAMGHVIITTILGFLVALTGIGITQLVEKIARLISSIVLFTIAGIFIFLNFYKGHKHTHLCEKDKIRLSEKTLTLSLIGMLTFSPCEAILPVFFTAGQIGWYGLLLLSLVMGIGTITGMVLMTTLGFKGIEKMKFHILEDYEKLIFGIIFIFIGLVVLFFH